MGDILYIIALISGAISTGIYLLALIPCYLSGAPNSSRAAQEFVENVFAFFTAVDSPLQVIAGNFTSDVRHMVNQVVQAWGLVGRGTRNGYNTGQFWANIVDALSTEPATFLQ